MSARTIAVAVGMAGALCLGAGFAIIIPLSIWAALLFGAGVVLIAVAATEVG